MLFGTWMLTPAASASITPTSPAASSIVGNPTSFKQAGSSLTFQLSASQEINGINTPVEIDSRSVGLSGTLTGKSAFTKASTTTDASQTKRQVMLLLDTSDSMNAGRIDAERTAANEFVNEVEGSGVEVGIVTFGDPANIALPPTPNLDAVRTKIGQVLKPAGDTAMFQAVVVGVKAMDKNATRSLLMISDGHNEDLTGRKFTKEQAKAALGGASTVNRVGFSGVLVGDEKQRDIYDIDGSEAVVAAQDGAGLLDELKAVVDRGAEKQRLTLTFTAPIPPEWYGEESPQIQISAKSDKGQAITIAPFNPPPFAKPAATGAGVSTPVLVQSPSGIPTWVFVAALVAVFGALVVLLGTAAGGFSTVDASESAVVRRVEYYSMAGQEPSKVAVTEQTSGATRLGDSALTRSAVGLMGRLARSGQMDRALDSQLEAAGLPVRTAEWMLLHIASAVGSALLLLLISGGRLVAMILGLIIGLAGPWLFLGLARSRREAKFLSQLPDTLQLLAGSLAAGYSLPQAMDAVVRESGPPISVEFNRALVEARLGMLPEDSLDGIATRTASQDFSWIVMAIRIQRDVGGNLAELLSSVADTLRERERLRRQVNALSAEGRLSGAILGALPLVFGLYLILTRPDYIAPLFDTGIGVLLLIVGGVLMVVGGFWMTKVIKVKV